MKAYSRPMIINAMGEAEEHCSALQRLPLSAKGAGGQYSEHWLQMLIQNNPTLLPVDELEPALTPLVAVCVELPLPSGFADNLLLTPDGGIVLVEAKLWRNGEARREVIGQVLDYAKDLSRLSYEDLQAAIRLARKDKAFRLYEHICGPDADEAEEARFSDAVSRNMRLGRFLLIIAGDGIQESAEQLADFLQRHVGLHFTLAMVEIGLWRAPQTGQVFVQPKIVTRTVQIERAVVRLEEGVAMAPSQIMAAAPNRQAMTISAETFYETLALIDPNLPDRLKAFLDEVEVLGVYPDVKRTMSLKWRRPDGRTFSLGAIERNGRIATDFAHTSSQAIGRVDLSHAYQARLVEAVPGASIHTTPNPIGWRAVLEGQNLPIAQLLNNKGAWSSAIADYIARLTEVSDAAELAH